MKSLLSFPGVLFTTTITFDQILLILVSAGNIGVDLHDLRGSLGFDFRDQISNPFTLNQNLKSD